MMNTSLYAWEFIPFTVSFDGYIDTIKNNIETLYLHCNWGWGGYHNGYFLADVFNAEESPYYDDNANPVTRSANFQYRLKTATICK